MSPSFAKWLLSLALKRHFENDGLMNTYSGISWRKTADGYELYWSTFGKTKSLVVQAAWNGKKISVLKTFSFETVKPAQTDLPNEVLVTEEVGSPVLYVVLNGNNTVEKLDINTGKTIWSSPVGVAPFGIAAANGKLYVTNWAGSVPDKGDADVAGVPWGLAKVDPLTGATREGTLQVLDPRTGKSLKEIKVGLHPNDIVAGKDQKLSLIHISEPTRLGM